ncbi:MAG: alpha/beta hydrolase [Hyphomicrobiaceae bacterium]|nr:alpha/beta hydrolase [Hyphomicrobiaceae bacterium]
MRKILQIAILIAGATGCGLSARADTAVQIGGAYALMNKPAAAVAGSVILVPGGDGVLGVQPDGSFSSLKGNQLVRTRKAYSAQGLASLTIDSGVNLAAAVKFMQTVAAPVTIVATSRGSLRVAGGLSAKPSAIVLTSAFLDDVKGAVGTPSALPRTLVVHHRQDGCKKTPPTAVDPFKAWGGAKVSVSWITGGTDQGDPCQARGYHGFAGQDAAVVSIVSTFAKSR